VDLYFSADVHREEQGRNGCVRVLFAIFVGGGRIYHEVFRPFAKRAILIDARRNVSALDAFRGRMEDEIYQSVLFVSPH
jgi:hypothetical protein